LHVYETVCVDVLVVVVVVVDPRVEVLVDTTGLDGVPVETTVQDASPT
jgi:hypothetical protein